MFIYLDNKKEKLSQWLKRKTTMDFSDWGVFILFIVGLIGIIYFGRNTKIADKISIIVLWFTAIAVMQYTKETYWLKQINRKQLEHQREISLRPVILRSGHIESFDNIQGKIVHIKDKKILDNKSLEFTVFRNIAKDIKGYVVINVYKHPLHFLSDITQVEKNLYRFLPVWGWMKPGYILYAIWDDTIKEKTNKKNQIFISYEDIEGNKYYTIEDKNFSQKSLKE
ncbi:MAG: hypothetical protein U9R14_04160 [Patescibacteria group bacterium]|nr:hypothetical protein [Patescibacteria group bacterium]